MDRRQYLACGLGGLSAVTAGCLTVVGSADCSDPWDPGVEAEEPTLARGESDSIRVEVERVTRLSLDVPEFHGENVDVDVADASVTPSPDGQLDTYPPSWSWEECTGAIVVPLEVAAAPTAVSTLTRSTRAGQTGASNASSRSRSARTDGGSGAGDYSSGAYDSWMRSIFAAITKSASRRPSIS